MVPRHLNWPSWTLRTWTAAGLSSAARIVSLVWRWATRSSALIDNAVYQFGDFTPAADNPSGIDSDGLGGATVYDYTLGPERRPWMD